MIVFFLTNMVNGGAASSAPAAPASPLVSQTGIGVGVGIGICLALGVLLVSDLVLFAVAMGSPG